MIADIKLGYACNNNCIHCVVADQRKGAIEQRGNYNRPTSEYIEEMTEFHNKGCNHIVFTGGEPTLRKDLLTLIFNAYKLGYNIGMQTNGRRFQEFEFAKKLSKFDISYTIALHHNTAEIHDKITRANGSYNQTVQGLKNLVKLDQKVFGKVVISKLNYKDLLKIVKLYKEIGVMGLNIAFPHINGNANKYKEMIVPSYTEIMPYVNEVIEFMENSEDDGSFMCDFEAIPLCLLEGKKSFCSDYKLLNSQNKSYISQLDGVKGDWDTLRKQIKSKFTVCPNCIFNNQCEGVWSEYPDLYGSNEFEPVKRKQ